LCRLFNDISNLHCHQIVCDVMRNAIRLTAYLCILLLSFSFESCRRELEPPEVENEILTPILHTKLNLANIIPDSLRAEKSDGSISLVYRNVIHEAKLNAFNELNTREFVQSAKLQKLKLSDRSVSNTITLGQITKGGPYEGLIILAHNSGNPFQIPEIANQSFGPEVLDGSSYFDEMTLDSGFMDITIENGFPTSISDINFEIRNQGAGNVVVDTTFDYVGPGETETRSVNIAGKSVEAFLEAFVTNFNVDQSAGPVVIDTSDALIVTVVTRDLKVFTAKAIFPAQDIIAVNDVNAMEGVGTTRITRAIAKSGFVNVEVESTIEDTLYFEYFIPDGTLNGESFVVEETINPAPSGGSIFKKFKFDVSGYEFGMTGFPVKDSVNIFYSELVGRIDSTGRKVNITLNDSIRVFVNLSGFVPEYIEGYAGDTTIDIGPEVIPLELFKKINGGSIEFSEVKMALSVVNGNNVPFDVDISTLRASNTRSGESVEIDLSSLPNPISVLGASDLETPWEKTWEIDSKTSLNAAIGILPNQFEAALSVKTNPLQDLNDLTQFAVDSNQLVAYADIEIPLDFIAKELILQDTVEFSGKNIRYPEEIGSGVMYLIANNSLPLEASVRIEFISGNSRVQTLRFDRRISASGTGKDVESVLALTFNKTTFDNILSADHAVMIAEVSTEGAEAVKIYSDMGIDLKLSSRFNYTYGKK